MVNMCEACSLITFFTMWQHITVHGWHLVFFHFCSRTVFLFSHFHNPVDDQSLLPALQSQADKRWAVVSDGHRAMWCGDPGGLKTPVQVHFALYPSLLTEPLNICESCTAGAAAALGMQCLPDSTQSPFYWQKVSPYEAQIKYQLMKPR